MWKENELQMKRSAMNNVPLMRVAGDIHAPTVSKQAVEHVNYGVPLVHFMKI